jgi:hypothetical protein
MGALPGTNSICSSSLSFRRLSIQEYFTPGGSGGTDCGGCEGSADNTEAHVAPIESIDLAGKRVRILHADLAQAFDLNYDQLVLGPKGDRTEDRGGQLPDDDHAWIPRPC